MSLKTYLKDIADAIRYVKDSEEPINAQNFASEIKSLSDKLYDFIIDNNIAYKKNVVSKSLSYAKIEKIGGMSYKNENLIVLDDMPETEKNGIKYSVKNGSITVKGTNSATSTTFIVIPLPTKLILNGTYSNNWFNSAAINSGHLRYEDINGELIFKIDDSSRTFMLNTTLKQITISVNASKSIDLTISPMLVKHSDNLLALTDKTETANGITLTCSNDTITMSGTATSGGTLFINTNMTLTAGTYELGLNKRGTFGTSKHYFTLRDSSNSVIGSAIDLVSAKNSTITISSTTTITRIGVSFISGESYDFTLKPVIGNKTNIVIPNQFKMGLIDINIFNPTCFKPVEAVLNSDEFTINSDTTDYYLYGVFNVDTSMIFFNLPIGVYQLISTNSNVRVTFYGDTTLDSTFQTTTLTSNSRYWGIRLRSVDGTSLKDKKFKIALYRTDVVRTEYKTYHGPLIDAKVNKIISSDNNNLLYFDDVPQTTKNGITYRVENGVFYYSGTATARVDINVNLSKPLELDGEYKLAFFNNQSGGTMRLFGGSELLNSLPISYANRTDSLNYSNNSLTQLSFMISAGTSVANAELKPMLVKGTTSPTEFKPYQGEIKIIPQSIQNLNSYGVGINSTLYNYIDYNNKKYIQQVQKLILDGRNDEMWEISTTENGYGIANFVCTFKSLGVLGYVANGSTNWYISNKEQQLTIQSETYTEGVYLNTERVFIRAKSLVVNTIEKLRQYLSLNPVEIIYQIPTPIETDISDLLDNYFIEVAPNGTIEFENEYKQSLPSTIVYQVEVK